MRCAAPGTILAWTLYAALLAALVISLLWARQRAIRVYGTREAQAGWDQWVEEAQRQAEGTGPVRRRVPASPAPPALVLMEQHFGACLTAALVLSSAVYWSLAWFVLGAVRRGRLPPPTAASDAPPVDEAKQR